MQNQGIGGILMREILAQADAAGKRVLLKVLRPNRARSFYESLGFVVTDEAPERFFMERPCPKN
jgi:ribosomal protein S18 acetylase RimI-like enzyme